MKETNHTFAICAYKESEYLEDCIASLKMQSVPTNIIMVTSTPNDYITNMAKKHNIPLYINEGEKGITQDWNYAMKMAATDMVTIAHQDDVYDEEYVANLLGYIKHTRNPLIFFTDYGEIREGEIVTKNRLLEIKRIMLFPLRYKAMWKNRWVRRRILSLGSAICCPSVTFVKSNLMPEVFLHGYRASEDWQAWERLSKLDGEFVFCSKILTYHRIHEDSETTKILADNKRIEEDYEMFCRFWPEWIAKILVKLYGKSENSNKLS